MQGNEQTKQCRRCRGTKPLTQFYDRQKLGSWCRLCWLAYWAAQRRSKGQRERMPFPRKGRFYDLPEGQKYCAKCQTVKAKEFFYLVRSDGQRRCAWCIPCVVADQERRRRAKGIKPRVDTSDTKRCPRCGETKPLSQYPKDPARARGINSYCFPCYRAYARSMAKKHGYNKQRAVRKAKGLGPSKHELAARMVFLAVKLGVLTKGPCAVCGTTEHIQGHHTDYTKPLEVTWLCRLHHFHAHGQLLDQTQ